MYLRNIYYVKFIYQGHQIKVKVKVTGAEKHVYVSCLYVFCLFTALMQTRYCDENSVRLSVRLSVRPSVTRMYCDKTVERSVQIYIPYERQFSLVF